MVNDTQFNSNLAPWIKQLIKLKRSVGFPYVSSEKILKVFDTMVDDQHSNVTTLTKKIADDWLNLKSDEHPNSLSRRITPVRQLGKFMKGLGIEAYVIPPKIPDRQIKYEAHIYSDKELKAFFEAVDNCPVTPYSNHRRYVIPTFFRLLYSCGLRSSETRLLSVNDVNLETGHVLIQETKGWKARNIYIDKSVLEQLKRYDKIISHIIPNRTAFFPNSHGEVYHNSTVNVWFHEFWDPLDVAKLVVGNPPRVHDFRHTFAVKRLNQWVKENKPIEVLYPYLSEFMGHSNFEDTDYYLKLVDEFYPQMETKLSAIRQKVIPEVYEYVKDRDPILSAHQNISDRVPTPKT